MNKSNLYQAGTLCLYCNNAVPGELAGCPWSREFVPVEGWTAVLNTKSQHGISYFVIDCPLYEWDGRTPMWQLRLRQKKLKGREI
jgi:hypothetical protein